MERPWTQVLVFVETWAISQPSLFSVFREELILNCKRGVFTFLKTFHSAINKVVSFPWKNKQRKILFDVRGQRASFSCNCHIVEKTRIWTRQGTPQALQERLPACPRCKYFHKLGYGALSGRQITSIILVCLKKKKNLHCFRDLLTFSVFLQASVWQMHTENFPAQATGNLIFSLPFLAVGHTALVPGL